MLLEEALEYYHNKGQEDYPTYDPPNQIASHLGINDRELAEIAAYKAGYQHAKDMAGD
jgi:hypothetical protein